MEIFKIKYLFIKSEEDPIKYGDPINEGFGQKSGSFNEGVNENLISFPEKSWFFWKFV